MSTLTELTQKVLENRNSINEIINQSVSINDLSSLSSIQDNYTVGIYDTDGNLTTKATIAELKNVFGIANPVNSTRFIILSNGEFRMSKKPGNTAIGLEVGDIVTNGYISSDVFVTMAVYNNNLSDGDINNFGTIANDFNDGNYKVEFIDFS